MSYVESFARAMERARASVSYWDRKTLDHLQAAHDAEMRQCSKSEYHRGFEDGQAVTAADQWQLERKRKAVVARLQAVNPSELCGSHETLSAICKAVYEPVMGWTVGAGELLRDRLIALMGGDTDLAKTDAKVPDSGHVRECPQFPTATYDVLGNERHKVVCELRKMRTDSGGFVKALANAVGVEWQAPRVARSLADVRDRLIYLLGADTILKEGGDGMARGDFERGTVPCDSVGARDVPEEAVVDECNFSTPESDMDAEDAGQNPAEIQEESSDHVSLGTQPVTDEQRDYADDYCYRGHFEAFKNTAYPMPWDNPAETSEVQCDHVSLGTPSSITDELRTWVRDLMPASGTLYIVGGSTLDELMAIADRIDEQFNRMCEQHESVLQQTISDTVDEHEREMADLRADYERATKLQREYGEKVVDLQAELRAAKHLHECNQRWCDALLDLIRDAAKDYQECQRLLRVFKCHVKDVRRERDELLDRLQAISVLCEQDDG